MKTLSRLTPAVVLFTALFLLFLTSCKKEGSLSTTETVTEEEATTYSDESTQAEAGFDDVEDVSMLAADEEGETSVYGRGAEDAGRLFPFVELRRRLGPCATITVFPADSSYPKTITIDFGYIGCLCTDGKFRRGKIVTHLTAPIRRPGSVMTITLDSFYLNRTSILGTKVVSNLSENGNIKFTVQVVGGKVTHPNGRGYTYNSLKYVRQTEGGNTRPVMDDVYKIEGRSKTEFNNGVVINLDTETPLVKKTACHWISDGTLKIKINSRVLYLNYGAPSNGDCDNKAILTWNNGSGSRLITLP